MPEGLLFIDRFPYKFLRYFHYRVSLFLCQFSMSDFAVPYKSCRSYKLVYMSNEAEITPSDYKNVTISLDYVGLLTVRKIQFFLISIVMLLRMK